MVQPLTNQQAIDIHTFVVDSRDLIRKKIEALEATDRVLAHVAKTRSYDVRARELLAVRDALQEVADNAQGRFNERWVADQPLQEPTTPKKKKRG